MMHFGLKFIDGVILLIADIYRLLEGQVWKLPASFFIFQNSAQMIVGLILLYTCRQFERQMGSRKFGAFLLIAFVFSILVNCAAIVAAYSVGLYLVPSPGPFALIFALMTYYYRKFIVDITL